jgi:hypothetical protein
MMGFLDFLKKKPAADPFAVAPAHDVDLEEVRRKIEMAPFPSDQMTPQSSVSPPPPPPSRNPAVGWFDGHSASVPDESFDDVPMPPNVHSDMLSEAADSMDAKDPFDWTMEGTSRAPAAAALPAESEMSPKAAAPQVPVTVISPSPREQPIALNAAQLDLPDFTDEDIADALAPEQEPQKAPAMPPTQVFASQPERVSAWAASPVPAAPSSMEEPPEHVTTLAMPEQPDDVPQPTGSAALKHIEPAMFLSSEAYFAITADVRSLRKLLRQNDDLLKDAELQHEQGDEHVKRLAQEMTGVQEKFMTLDGALFEE